MAKKIYTFGDGKAEGKADMRNLLGGKGANLAEMNLMGMPVPPGFTITTEVCTEYTQLGRDAVVNDIKAEVEKAIAHVENLTGKKFDDPANPLLVSVRSGARASMPGMMDTVLNLGMNDATVATMAEKSGNPRFAWDSYRRFVQMYGDVVLGMKPKSKTDIDPFEAIMDQVKEEKGVKFDNELNVDDFKELVVRFKKAVKEYTGKDFPESAWEQLWGGICAVFDSWMNERAIIYRRMNQIPRNGELPSTCRPWYMETWVTTPPPGWLSAVTPQPVRTFSTENISSTPRARMSWPVSALPSRSPSKARAAGQPSRVSAKMSAA